MTHEEYLKAVLALDANEQLTLGKKAYVKLKELSSNDEALKLVNDGCKLAVSADRQTNMMEWKAYRVITNTTIDYDRFFEITNGGAGGFFVSRYKSVYQNMRPDRQKCLFTIILVMLLSDGDYNDAKRNLIASLIDISSQ